MNFGRAIAIIFLGTSINLTVSADVQPLNSIISTATTYALEQASNQLDASNIQISHGDLDPRLRLPLCAEKLVAFDPPGSRFSGNTTVGVKCESPKPWSIYVPVKIATYQTVVVMVNPLPRGEVISYADVETTEYDTSQIRGIPFHDIEQVVGTKTKTRLNPGAVIQSSHVCLVCKGDLVNITASATQIAVVMSGVAMSDGSEGESIRVQNSSSKRVIEATVISGDTVRVIN